MVLDYQNDDAGRALDPQQVLDWQRGWQVVDPAGGSNLVTAGSGNFEYDAAAGDINAGGTIVSCTSGTADDTVDFSGDVDPDDDKLAVIYRDSSGVLQKNVTTGGTAVDGDGNATTDIRQAVSPAPATLYNANGVVLAEVIIPAGASSIGEDQKRDRRLPAELGLSTHYVDSDTTTAGSGVYLVDTSAAPRTLEVSTNDIDNQEAISVMNLNASNNVTVATEGAQTIDPGAAATKNITSEGSMVHFGSHGSGLDSSLKQEFEEVNVINANGSTIGGDPIIGVPSTGSNPGLSLGGSFTVLDADRPVEIHLSVISETDGSTNGDVRALVDESGGSSADVTILYGRAAPEAANGFRTIQSAAAIIPAGASVQVQNSADPNNNNSLLEQRMWTL